MRHAARRTAAVLALALLLTGVATMPATATAPTADQVGRRDRRALWLGPDTTLLVFRSDSSWQCIASEPAALAFGLGYAAAKRSPEGVERIWRRAEGSLEPAGDPATRASNELARISRPDLKDVDQALAGWPPHSRRVLEALAAGMNLALEEEGREAAWNGAGVAVLALQQQLFRPLDGDGAAVAADPGTAAPIALAVQLGGKASEAWGQRLAGWAESLFPWLQAAEGEEPATDPGLFVWIDPRTTPSPVGVLVWVDASGSLGVVYRGQPLEDRLNALERILDGVQPES